MRLVEVAESAFRFFGQAVRKLVRIVLQIAASLIALIFLGVLVGLILAVPAALIYSIYKAFPHDPIQAKPNASWLDLIFSNQYVVFAARIVLISLALVLLFAGIYISTSIFMRMYRKEWLKKAGGLEAAITERAADQVDESREEYEAVINDLMRENEELTNLLEQATSQLEEETEHDDDGEEPDQDVPRGELDQ